MTRFGSGRSEGDRVGGLGIGDGGADVPQQTLLTVGVLDPTVVGVEFEDAGALDGLPRSVWPPISTVPSGRFEAAVSTSTCDGTRLGAVRIRTAGPIRPASMGQRHSASGTTAA